MSANGCQKREVAVRGVAAMPERYRHTAGGNVQTGPP